MSEIFHSAGGCIAVLQGQTPSAVNRHACQFASHFYCWIAKVLGLQYHESLGQIDFWIFLLGVNITFFPMHFLGLRVH